MRFSKRTDLNNIRYLLEAADSGSFSAAARVFGVPPSLVSRKIARLEKEVGARLFQRTTRSLSLTDAGLAFINHARSGMESFSRAHELVGDSQGILNGRVRLSAPVGMAVAVWATISKFLTLHPGVRIEIEVADRFVDLVEERFDLAIRSGAKIRADNLVGRRLSDSPRYLFASPKYLKLRGTPRALKDLIGHDCVILGARADRISWQLQIGKRHQNIIVQGRVAVNEATIAAECAADGFGIAYLPRAVAEKHVKSGRLKRIMPQASGGDIGLWLIYPNRQLPAVSRALAEFLLQELPASIAVSL